LVSPRPNMAKKPRNRLPKSGEGEAVHQPGILDSCSRSSRRRPLICGEEEFLTRRSGGAAADGGRRGCWVWDLGLTKSIHP
jgi:hypothetical protein